MMNTLALPARTFRFPQLQTRRLPCPVRSVHSGASGANGSFSLSKQQPDRLVARARSSSDSEAEGTDAFGLDPTLELAVPSDQRPVNELKQLKNGQLYSWGTLELNQYALRLAGVFAFFFALIGGPVAYQTFDPYSQPIEWLLSGATGSMVVVALVVLRIYLGWSYVGDRLLSAAVAYEETGWYDGQTFIKPPEVLTRDRLLGMYEVKPILRKLRTTLLGTGGALLVISLALFGIIQAGADQDGIYGRGAGRSAAVRAVTADGILYSSRVRDLSELAYDEALAAEEAAAQGDVPGYCGDRYFRAMAGGQYCDKYDAK